MKILVLLAICALFIIRARCAYYEGLSYEPILFYSQFSFPPNNIQTCFHSNEVTLYLGYTTGVAAVWESRNYSLVQVTNVGTSFPCGETDPNLRPQKFFYYDGYNIWRHDSTMNSDVLLGQFLSGLTTSTADQKNFAFGRDATGIKWFSFDAVDDIPLCQAAISTTEIYPVVSFGSQKIAAVAFILSEGSGFANSVTFPGCDLTDPTNTVTLLPDLTLTDQSVKQKFKFVHYDNILFIGYLNINLNLVLQSSPAATSTYTLYANVYQYAMVGMDKDNSTLLGATVSSTGEISVFLWDSAGQMALLELPLHMTVDPNTLQLDCIDLLRLSDTRAQLTISADNKIYAFYMDVMGTKVSVPDVVVEEVLLVDSSTTVGNLTLGENSTIIINEGSVITVTGCASLDGILQIVLKNETVAEILLNGVEILVMEVTCRQGDFNEIKVQSDHELEDCEKWVAKPIYSPTQLNLVISMETDRGCNGSNGIDTTGLIIGVVIGGAVLIVGILLFAFYCSPIREKVFPYAKNRS